MNNTVKNLKSLIKSTLKGDERLWFVNQDNEQEFNQTLLLDLVEKVDNKIISLLLQEEVLREKFFVKIVPPRPAKLSTPQEGNFSYVFKTNEFRFFMEENKVDNSYTSFKNRIGLTDGKKFLKDSGDIVLDWPYKDCVLEGGQSTEEGSDIYFEYDTKSTPSGKPATPQEGNYIKKQGKRKEIFFNQVLAQDEIDRLLDPKALVNWKRFDKNGKTPLLSGGDEVDGVDALKRNEDGTIAENLIIKGNNLLALHSLKKQFRGKVKLIYIDPPYNTGNDGFKYNDNFNHSTWLTFMKNRLEVARELLREDGVIFVQCDDNEQAYLKVLMDEVFGNNFLNTISVKAKVSAGASGGGEDKRLKKNIEYIHCYFKKDFIVFNDLYKETEIVSYIQQMKNEGKSFKYTQVLISTGEKEILRVIKDGSGEDITIYKHSGVVIKTISQLIKEENLSVKEVYKKYFNKIFTTTNAQSSIRQRVWDATGKNNDFFSIEYIPKSGRNKDKLTTQFYTGNKKVLLIWFSDTAIIDSKGNVIKKEKYGTFWDGIDYNNLNKEGDNIFSSGKKPEKLIQRIVEMSTEKGDIVLDYHLGSGTTCAVAHKMGRQYIGIEQMDYIETIAVERLKKVIRQSTSPAKAGTPQDENIPLVEGWTAKQDGVDSFDTGGISKAINWQGGGDFIYFELAKWNQQAKEIIQAAESLEEMIGCLDELSDKYFLNYNLKMQEFREKVILEAEFQTLSLESQKAIFMAMLDNNQMYVNKSEMADEKFGISEEEQKLTEEFYK